MTDSNVDVTIAVTLPPEVAAKLKETGRNKGCTESGVIRNALAIYLDNWKWYDMVLQSAEIARKSGIGPDDVERLIDEYREEVQSENHQPD